MSDNTPAPTPAPTPVPTTKTHAFQAEVSQLLDIVVHSLYKDRDIFIRELVSNASDALEKIRHLQLAGEKVHQPDAVLEIAITTDDAAGTITISDTGVGMNRDELVANIGTIAHSGTKAFLQAIKENGGANENLIGRFGVGFFSVFMVARNVAFYTRSWHADGENLCWQSDGSGYSIETLESEEKRGSRIVITLQDEFKEFATASRVKDILLRYSKYVPVPLLLNGEKLNTVQAIWLKNKSEVSAAEYKEFYKFHCHAWDEPLEWLHFNADAPLVINALLFFPSENTEKTTFALPTRTVSLHCRKILVDDAPRGLLPDWLRFLKGVVDSADLPLNISRETMQDTALVQKLNRVLSKRIIKHIEEVARRDAALYDKFWREFGIFIKEGIVTDHINRDALAPLLRYESSHTEPGKTTSLDEYISRLKPDQKAIYHLTGHTRAAIENGPYLEAFKARGIEVLFFTDATDDFVANHLNSFKEKDFADAGQADLDLGDTPAATGEPLPEKRLTSLCEWLKSELTNTGEIQLTAVGTGNRLVDSPAAALNTDKYVSASMRRLLKSMNRSSESAPSVKLELNPRHSLIHKLDNLRDTDPAFARLVAEQIFANALLAAGLLDNPRDMTARIYEILEAAASRK
ncbi:MAG: molecular chaperone HtpG [Puniceicoccales bacterium]|jgi:molecular chaperone HtpG|nr:molecular chaperone HtpG [Puniceicoccales bacterium]